MEQKGAYENFLFFSLQSKQIIETEVDFHGWAYLNPTVEVDFRVIQRKSAENVLGYGWDVVVLGKGHSAEQTWGVGVAVALS